MDALWNNANFKSLTEGEQINALIAEIIKKDEVIAKSDKQCQRRIQDAVDDEIKRTKTAWCNYLKTLRHQLQSALNANNPVGNVQLNAQIKIIDQILVEKGC